MVRSIEPPPELLLTPFRGSDAVRRGMITSDQLRNRRWRRIFRDVYLARTLPDTVATRAAAAGLVLPAGAVVSGRSATWLYGADVVRPNDPLEITVPRECHYPRRSGLLVRRAALPSDECVLVGGIPVTTPARTGLDLARWAMSGGRANLVEAVVALDALLQRQVVAVADVAELARCHPGWRGVRQVAYVLTLVEPCSESPMETRLRLVLVLGGLPRPTAQLEVFDEWGRFVARIDLAYGHVRLGIEYDGRGHLQREAKAADDRRANRLREEGWTLLRYTDDAVFRYPGAIVHQVRRVLAQAA